MNKDPKESVKDEDTIIGLNIPRNFYDFAVAVFCLDVVIVLYLYLFQVWENEDNTKRLQSMKCKLA